MKASLFFDVNHRATKNGYPIFIRLSHLRHRAFKRIGHCQLDDWNFERLEPLKSHPDYYDILPRVLETKALIKKINYSDLSFSKAKDILFGETKAKSRLFYDAGLQVSKPGTNGGLYKTVLNSFNKVHPDIVVDEITPSQAKQYMDSILQVNSPNGVHTYMRTLHAIFNKVSTSANPFKGVRPKKVKTANKALTIDDVKKLANTLTFRNKFDGHNTNESINHYRYIWLLMFYLGGIDMIDLAKLRYDRHVVDGRCQFNRSKGGTNVFVNNKIFPEAEELLKKFDCYPYLVPIYRYKRHNDFVSVFNDRFTERTKDLELTKRPLTKSARYTFITRAQQLLIDERITIEIVGHAQQSTHSIYTDAFPLEVRDAAHERIIDL